MKNKRCMSVFLSMECKRVCFISKRFLNRCAVTKIETQIIFQIWNVANVLHF